MSNDRPRHNTKRAVFFSSTTPNDSVKPMRCTGGGNVPKVTTHEIVPPAPCPHPPFPSPSPIMLEKPLPHNRRRGPSVSADPSSFTAEQRLTATACSPTSTQEDAAQPRLSQAAIDHHGEFGRTITA